MDLHALDVLINDAGTDTSDMETAVLELDQSDPKVVALREMIEAHGGKLAAIQQWSTNARGGRGSSLPPGMVVADVGDPDGYTGTLDPDDVTLPQWAYYSQHQELWAKEGGIFSRKPVMRNTLTGYVYTPGDLATTAPEPGPFAGL